MKNVVTCILKEGDGERFELDVALSRFDDPDTVVERLIRFKNKSLLFGEDEVQLVRIRKQTDKVCYSHDWKKKGDHYICMDCKIPGTKVNIFGKVKPTFKDKKYKDCSWKIKIEPEPNDA